jgi:tetratricopeptide (TPR) repeat protein
MNPTVREVLDRGAQQLRADKKPVSPAIRAAQLDAIGCAYRGLGKYAEAEAFLQEAYDLRLRTFGAEHEAVAASQFNLAWLGFEQGKFTQAELLYERCLAQRRKLLPADDPTITATLFNLAAVLTDRGDFARAEQLFEEVVARRRRQHGDRPHREVALALAALATCYFDQTKILEGSVLLPEISRQFRQAVAQDERNKSLDRVIECFQLALVQQYILGNPRGAEGNLRECLRRLQDAYGEQHIYVALICHQLAKNLADQKKDAEAEPLFGACLTILRQTVGLGYPRASVAVLEYGIVLDRLGRSAEADNLFAETRAAQQARYGADHPVVAETLNYHADLLRERRDFDGSAALNEQALAIFRRHHDRFPPRGFARCLNNLAMGRAAQQRYVEAEQLLRESLPLIAQRYGAENVKVAIGHDNLAGVLIWQGKFTPEVYQHCQEALRITGRLPSLLAERNTVVGDTQQTLGAYYRHLGEIDKAVQTIRERRRLWAADPTKLFRLTCEMCGCARKAESARRAAYAAEADALFRQAVAKGLTNPDQALQEQERNGTLTAEDRQRLRQAIADEARR